ncbi:hypothetical protein, partial [Bradyrhizobium pachyrhizi]|uniref:hypothetical protein n=1 Tax=Bradyrhizobium pachyrhizi TaxID=280333 RepID=UPI001AEC5D7E
DRPVEPGDDGVGEGTEAMHGSSYEQAAAMPFAQDIGHLFSLLSFSRPHSAAGTMSDITIPGGNSSRSRTSATSVKICSISTCAPWKPRRRTRQRMRPERNEQARNE